MIRKIKDFKPFIFLDVPLYSVIFLDKGILHFAFLIELGAYYAIFGLAA